MGKDSQVQKPDSPSVTQKCLCRCSTVVVETVPVEFIGKISAGSLESLPSPNSLLCTLIGKLKTTSHSLSPLGNVLRYMEIFCSRTALVTVPLFQDFTKAKIVAWQDMRLISKKLCQRMAGESQRLFSKMKIFLLEQAGHFSVVEHHKQT